MNKTNTWKWALVALLLAWAFYSIYPPTAKDLIEVFKAEAVNNTREFTNIVNKAEDLKKEDAKNGVSYRPFQNLMDATGTNELKGLFTTIDVTKEKDPNRAILTRLQRKAAGKIKLGLDLRGGTSFLMGMDTNNLATNASRASILGQAADVLRRRVDKLGVAEPLVQPQGEDRILIQLPAVSEADKESYRKLLEKAAYLEFRLVHPRSAQLVAQGLEEPNYERLVLTSSSRTEQGPAVYLVKKGAEMGLTGSSVVSAGVSRDPVNNELHINFRLDEQGSALFAEITRAHVNEQLAIVLDGELYSAANIKEPIMGGSVSISGSYTLQEAHDLANVLENPLKAPVKVLEENSVDPTLGADAIKSGLYASLGGVAAVVVFMVFYYMLGGFVACIALAINIVLLIGTMASVGTTLTLPGIAGIVLTIGMAVDANVLIFERIREELATGKSLRGALAAGYDRAFATIFDSHVTTLISSIILIYMGTGTIKGFGVALTIGVAISLFTALVVTRLIFDAMLEKGHLTTLKMRHLIKSPNVDFMKWAKPAFIASWSIIAIGIGWGLFQYSKAPSNIMGIEFMGGDTMTLRYDGEKIPVEKLRETILSAEFNGKKVSDPEIQYEKDLGSSGENLRITVEHGAGASVLGHLTNALPQAKFSSKGTQTVGPTVGEEIQQSAVIATLLSLFGILIYVALRYEFSFAMGAVVAIAHDILMTLGVYFLFGRHLNATMVAAVLTIIGFSINDTVVIFDRIREDLKLGIKGSFTELVNKALNQTLSRTIITSGTVFLATLSLFLFGGGAINDFSFTFLVGIITGTYSSIYIASAFVLWWHKGERPKMAVINQVGTENVGQVTKA